MGEIAFDYRACPIIGELLYYGIEWLAVSRCSFKLGSKGCYTLMATLEWPDVAVRLCGDG